MKTVVCVVECAGFVVAAAVVKVAAGTSGEAAAAVIPGIVAGAIIVAVTVVAALVTLGVVLLLCTMTYDSDIS